MSPQLSTIRLQSLALNHRLQGILQGNASYSRASLSTISTLLACSTKTNSALKQQSSSISSATNKKKDQLPKRIIRVSNNPKSSFFHSSPSIQQSAETVIDTIETSFPNAYKDKDLVSKVHHILAQNGYEDEKTLFATSLCCDEVNRELELEFTNLYNFNFSMGGLAGFPFGGVTSFGAMAHHIPDDGSCFILYGPHVGIDFDGNVGKLNRRGRHGGSGACCGSAAAAYGYVKHVSQNQGEINTIPDDSLPALDAQQTFVGNMLLPQSSRLLDPNVDADIELPLSLFDVQDEFMKKIVEKGCGEVAGDGKIAMLGGVQINTPIGTCEYFLPKVFEIRDNKGHLVVDLLDSL